MICCFVRLRWQIGSFFELLFLVLLFGPDRVAGWV
jgi:hypothetical protein